MAGSSTVGQNNQGGTIVNREGKSDRVTPQTVAGGKTNRYDRFAGFNDTGVRKTVTPYKPPTAVVTTPPPVAPTVTPTVKAPTSLGVGNSWEATLASWRNGGTVLTSDQLTGGNVAPGTYNNTKTTFPNGTTYGSVTVGKDSSGGTSVGNWGSDPTGQAGQNIGSSYSTKR